ncbi:MAG TPA: SMP-30/gluconolactonase/LRE family protein [Steroidobacteraceae bacterium]|nr:SMP-30/gluconolactonase/LRE family protein [Steroidobacteraceae bacterium]
MKRARWPWWLACLLPGLALAVPPAFPGAKSDYRAWVAAELPGAPEGLTVDQNGRLFAAVAATGQIFRLKDRGGVRYIATVPDKALGRVGRTWGLSFDRAGYLYAAYVWHYTESEEMDPLHLGCRNSKDVYTGVYRIDVRTGKVTPWLTKRGGWPICFPDDIASDSAGNLYVTDLTLSGIWKVTPDRHFSLWSSDPLLQWPPPPYDEVPEGANDLALSADGRSLYVVTDGAPMLLQIPVQANGSAGRPRVIAEGLSALDGITLDERGNIYVSEILRSDISAFSPDGQQRVLVATAATAPLVNPTSLVYRSGVLCAANLGWHHVPEPHSVTCMSGFHRPKQ